MSPDHVDVDLDPDIRPDERERFRRIAGQLEDVDFARVDPPVELWGRIAAGVAADLVPVGGQGEANAALDRLRAIAGQLDDEDFARVDPPAALWARIAAAVEADGEPDGGADAVEAPVVSLDAHRRRRHRRVLAAVAAAVVLVAVTGAVLLQAGSSPDGDEPQLVASTELDPLEPVGGATAEVRLVRQDDHLQLELDAHDMAAAPEGQHYELWLLDPASASAEPVSLGAMSGSTTVPVPAGVDPDEYDVVDVSLQEQGQTEHSGHSLLRGTLA